jgi:hypothetical protein
LKNHGAVQLNSGQLERLTKAAFVFKEGQGAGCPEPVVNKDFIGKDPSVLKKRSFFSRRRMRNIPLSLKSK